MTESPQPIRPDLWALVEPALRAVRRSVDQFLSASNRIPSEYAPEYAENAVGWPAVVSRNYDRHERSPFMKWEDLVGFSAGLGSKVDLLEIEEAQILFDFVEADEVLSSRMGMPWGVSDTIPKRRRVEIGGTVFLREILRRAHAMRIVDAAEMLPIYLLIERNRLADKLVGDLIVPLPLVRFADIEELDLGHGVSIIRLSEAEQRARARTTGDKLNPFFSSAATHAIQIQNLSYENQHWQRLSVGLWEHETDLVLVDKACQAIDIATGVHAGYAEVLIRPADWAEEWVHDLPPIHLVATVRRHHENLMKRGWHGPGFTVVPQMARDIPVAFQSLMASDRRVDLAARRLFQSGLRIDDDDVVVDCCIGIEALVGDEHDELTHRMAQRAAVVLAPRGRDPHFMYAITKKVYGERSSIVHGVLRKSDSFKVKGAEYHTSSTARWLLRELLASATSATPPWTPADIDRRILASVQVPDLQAEALGRRAGEAAG